MSVSFQILIKNKAIHQYHHEGKIFVEGRPGSEYELELRNNSHKRVLAVISVDGLSVIDGTAASSDSPGYLIPAYGSIRVPGWKLDSAQVAKFTFGNRKDSYASASTDGSEANCGVFGVLVYSEQEYVLPPNTVFRGMSTSDCYRGIVASGATFDSTLSGESITKTGTDYLNASSNYTNNLGTGFGEPSKFVTTEVDFKKGAISGQIVVQYDDSKGLERRGIVLNRTRNQTEPNPFPGGYGCTPPKNWPY